MMSHLGHNVTCIDTDNDKISKLKNGICTLYEPGLEEYLKACLESGRLHFKNSYDEELRKADAIFITVGTPSLPSGKADLSFVFSSLDKLSEYAKSDCLIVIKSTVPPGSTAHLQSYLRLKGYQFLIASNPEFLREGAAIEDFLSPCRIIIGSEGERAKLLLEEIYAPLITQKVPCVFTDLTTAELIKYASNSFLATKVAFINEIADICEIAGGDIDDLSLGIGLDQRIGKEFLKAGPGFGGSCFPKDMLALSNLYKEHNSKFLILDAVITANSKRAEDIIKKIKKIIGDVRGKEIGILGLAFKAGTDDLRDSPAIQITRLLLSEGAKILAYDPEAMDNCKKLYPKIPCTDDANIVCRERDLVIICTEWPEFRKLEFNKDVPIMDLRNMFSPKEMSKKELNYFSIGRTKTGN
jgi:UDPglucose 6-dehydrogenase